MKEINAVVDTKGEVLTFKRKDSKVYSIGAHQVNPGETKVIPVYATVKRCLFNTQVVVKLDPHLKRFAPSLTLSQMTDNTFTVTIHNPTKSPIKLYKSRYIGIILRPNQTGFVITEPGFAHNSPQDKCMLVYQRERDSRENIMNDYPFLEKNDPRIDMNPIDILKQDLPLNSEKCMLNKSEQEVFLQQINEYNNAFSLYGEIGTVTSTEVDFSLEDKKPFYIRPFRVSQSEKEIIDKEMEKLTKMGIIKRGRSAYTSPMMLIQKKTLGPDGKPHLRCLVDLRQLNLRIKTQNHPFPLVSDTICKLATPNQIISVLQIFLVHSGL